MHWHGASRVHWHGASRGGQDSSVGEKLGLVYKSQVGAAAAGGVYGTLASLVLQIASMASEHHGKNVGRPNQWIIMDKNTSGLLMRSTCPFSISVADLWRVMCYLAYGRVMCKLT